MGLAAGAFVVCGLLFPPPSAPPPTAPPPIAPPVPPLVPPPSSPSTILAKLPLVGTGTSLELLGTEPLHSWRLELAKLGLLAALLALAASVGCHIGITSKAHRSDQAVQAVSLMASPLHPLRRARATCTQTPKAEMNDGKQPAAAATAARAAAARAAAARSLVQILVTRTWERALAGGIPPSSNVEWT